MSLTPSLTAIGASTPIALRGSVPGSLPPSIVCGLSSGGVLTYNVEITAAGPDQITGVYPSDNWAPLPGASGLTGSSATPIGMKATAVRVNTTAYTSGSLSVAVSQ